MLDWRANDEVWFTVRAFDAPVRWRTGSRSSDAAPSPRAVQALSAGDLAAVLDPDLMGGPLPIGEPAPADGALPADTRIDAAHRLRRLPARAVLPRAVRLLRLQHLHGDELRGARQDQYADTLLAEVALARGVLAAAGAGSARQAPSSSAAARRRCCPRATWRACSPACASAFGLADDAEVTVEANPDTVTRCRRRRLAAAGVTRLSIGMQSAVPHVLAALDRTHDPAERGRRGRRRPRGPASRSASTSSMARRGSRSMTGGVARGGARARARPHLRLRADHRGRHEARTPDQPRRGARTRRRPAGRHVRARRRGCSERRASTGTR